MGGGFPHPKIMNVELSWDLFVLVFFVVIVAYSFIIGTNNTLKVILGTYVAALSADALGNLIGKSLNDSEAFDPVLSFAQVGNDSEAVVFVKVIAFVLMVILFAVRGAFEVDALEDRSIAVRTILNALYAGMSAGLIISVILVFVSGVSFIGGGNAETPGTALWDLYNQSQLIRSILSNAYLWFSVPALAFLVHSIYGHHKS